MISYISKAISKPLAVAGLYAMTLLGGCGDDEAVRQYQEFNVPEAEGYDVSLTDKGSCYEMSIGDFNRLKPGWEGPLMHVSTCNALNSLDIFLMDTPEGDSLESVANPESLRKINSAVTKTGKGVRM